MTDFKLKSVPLFSLLDAEESAVLAAAGRTQGIRPRQRKLNLLDEKMDDIGTMQRTRKRVRSGHDQVGTYRLESVLVLLVREVGKAVTAGTGPSDAFIVD